MSAMSTRLKVLVAVLVLAVAGGGYGVYWFLKDDAPAEVSLDAAREAREEGADADDAPAAFDGSVEGTWEVDTESGEFSFDDSATGSYVGFRIQEELSGIGSTTAVGRTPGVSGQLVIEGTTLTQATFEAALASITTNDRRRDSRVQSALDTGQFPVATFELSAPLELGAADATSGEELLLAAAGNLTVHGVTKAVEIPIEAQLLADGSIVVIGSLRVVFADFDVEVPSSPIVVSAEDNGILEVQLFFTRT